MTSNERTPTELRDAYYELSMSEGLPDPEMLDTLIRLYPQYARELTSFAVDLTVDRLSQDDNVAPDVVPVIGAAGSHAVSAYHNTIYNLRKRAAKGVAAPAAAAAAALENPFMKLDKAGIRAAAQAIGANSAFISKLRDRVIDAATISQGFLKVVADALRVETERLWAHLSSDRTVPTEGQHFKADQKPVLGQKQSFEDAVRSSGLTEEQQRRLLSL